jgi:abortive infection alpha-like protein
MAEMDGSVTRALPGLVRVAAMSGWRVFRWSVGATLGTGAHVVKALASGEPPAKVIQETALDFRLAALQALGMSGVNHETDLTERTRQRASTREELRARGAELLYQSADVRFSEETHPAYARILDELAPDEARILRFLVVEGPQPSVDVRTSRPLGAGSELIAPGLSMIGLQSGVRDVDHTNAYLNNLYRLGLIWFSRETVEPDRYQVVEVQPEVADAMKKAGRTQTVRRSIHLTPFGEDFCQTCLPTEVSQALPPQGD